MHVKMYQVDAFTDELFHGNPAAVCLLDEWPDDKLMQSIAEENNLAETAFIVKSGNNYEIRWFTPTVEVDLCGHATLASAHIIFSEVLFGGDEITFLSRRSGTLKVRKDGPMLTLNFPADHFEQVNTPTELAKGLGIQPAETYKGRTDYMAVLTAEDEVIALEPHYGILAALACRGIIVTARGEQSDFVSRFFAPQSGINEDPVTGSAHTTLIPYWSKVLNKDELTAVQLSKRRGYLQCRNLGSRVEISGNAITYMEATLEI